MKELELRIDKFQNEALQFLLSLQTVRVIDEEAFMRIYSELILISKFFKYSEVLPKKLLYDISTMVKILRAEAPFFDKNKDILFEMSNKVQMIFELILKGETLEQRDSNIPRII